jgi:peptide subunit release factor 1 (eRF1)
MSDTEAPEMAAPDLEDLDREAATELLGWQPGAPIFSVYVRADPGDRAGRRLIELRDELDRAVGAEADRPEREELRTAARRIEEEVSALAQEPSGRGVVGFVEATRAPGAARWYRAQLAPVRTEVHLGPTPKVAPLLAMLEEGSPTGVAAVSGECVRLFDWRVGELDQLHDWELEVFSLDWRERKAPGGGGLAVGGGVSAAGHDQYEQRLDHNRDRFARETGALARQEGEKRGWRQVLVFGDERHTGPFMEGLGEARPVVHVDRADLVSQPSHQIAERVEQAVPEVNRERQRALVERIKDSGFAGGRASLGAQETAQALAEGRVEQLVYDARLDGPDVERLIALATDSGAAIVPVEGAAAAELTDQDGVAALLRY